MEVCYTCIASMRVTSECMIVFSVELTRTSRLLAARLAVSEGTGGGCFSHRSARVSVSSVLVSVLLSVLSRVNE